MGDTGSLVLGTVCTISALHTLEVNMTAPLAFYSFESGPSIIIGLFALPIFDTVRVFVLRIARGNSPLIPDKNHIHHLLVQTGLTHMQSTAALLVVTTFFVMMALRLQNMGLMIFICFFILIGSILSLGLFSLVSSRRKVANS
jgi:UDP-N-acetylmuramyl pentapeptide phosphotransferase/UDP-N-acetylglucosamine-1-phosphate transferase